MTNKFDLIHIQNIRVKAILGLYPEERLNPQDFIVSAKLYLDLKQAGVSDDLNDTVDYDSLHRELAHIAKTSECLLIEKLAELCANKCLTKALVQACEITIDKPEALELADNVAISIYREK
jgi:FolB domain-containing protein